MTKESAEKSHSSFSTRATAGEAERTAWNAGAAEEADFWEDWLETAGGAWPDDYRFRCDPRSPLQADITDVLDAPEGTTLQILDVGAGPLTYLGKRWKGRTLRITAVDPLAQEYAELLAKHHVQPLVRTQQGHAERLVEQFPENTFDLVHARNCIDHSYSPCLAIQQMLFVAKPGGLVYMHHAVNEGETQHYQGFHQWNLYEMEGDLFVGNPRRTVNVSRTLSGIADMKNQVYDGGSWIVTQIRKHS